VKSILASTLMWRKGKRLRWPLVLAMSAAGTAAGQFMAFRFGVQSERRALLMLLFVAALMWLSNRTASQRTPEADTLEGD